MTLPLLKESLKNASVIQRKSYDYFIHPLTDGIPQVNPRLLDEVTEEYAKRLASIDHVDTLVTVEAMGLPITTAVSQKTGIPFTVIRKRKYHLPDEITVTQHTGYDTTTLSVNGIHKDDSVVFIDDVLSTTGTIRAVLSAIKKKKAVCKRALILINKSPQAAPEMYIDDILVESLLCIKIVDGKVFIQ